jgi:hypothetical protein
MQNYWCIKPSIESEGCGDNDPRAPYEVIVEKRYDILFRVNSIHIVNGEIKVDDDTNASAYVRENELFATKELAMEAYKKAICEKISDLEDQAFSWAMKLNKLCDE